MKKSLHIHNRNVTVNICATIGMPCTLWDCMTTHVHHLQCRWRILTLQ